MNAAIPALPSVWPMFPLTEPSRHGSPPRVLCTSPSALRLDHVAENCAGAVGFDEGDLVRLDLRES